MRIIKPSAEIISYTPDMLQNIEAGGRTCYKSEDKMDETTAPDFIERMKNFKHESVLEHGSVTVRFICDRGVSHEIVRHRLASYSQESTRYCNYSKGKFGNEITVIDPCFWDSLNVNYTIWKTACEAAEEAYLHLIQEGATAQEARSVLPNSLKTEIFMTTNPREWRHFFSLRTKKESHPQMVEVARPLLVQFREKWPPLFNDVGSLGD